MQIKSVKVENFLSQNYNSSSFVLDPKDLSTLFGINDGNCRSAFRALAFAAEILLWKWFWNMLAGKEISSVVDNTDARKMKISNDSATLIVTSPPYVTSYEYADLHQLTAIWLGYADSLSDFRSKFIGSIQKDIRPLKLYSKTGKEIADKLRSIDKREADGVEQYFFEMQECFEEMHRVLIHGGKAAIVIGDTDLKKVKIQNANVFVETMENIEFKTYKIIRRPIPSKILPLTRDEKTGRFASTSVANRLAYPIENILIMEKI